MRSDQPDRPAWLQNHRLQAWFLGIIAFGIVLFLLVEARFLLISLAIAIILFSLTSDAINYIGRLRIAGIGIPNWLASMLAVALIASGLLTLSGVLLSQVNTILITTLSYTEQAQFAIADLFRWMGEDVSQAVLGAVRDINVGSYLRSAAGQAGNVMSATVLVILFVGFLFAERVWFPAKLTSLFPDPGRADQVRRTIGTIMRRVNRYLLVKTAVSIATGLMVYGVMRAFGLDLALPMAIATFVLNYIPNIGSIIATGLVTLVTYVQFADPTPTLIVFVVTGVIQFVNGSIIDPTLMGRALRLSSFGIIISLAFWSVVWGIPGMFLSVPIMVAIMIVCSQHPALHPLAILLSREGIPSTLSEDETLDDMQPSRDDERKMRQG
ncbi:AI-2E family transporter [Maritimibacter sp. 55A14]|uniref:AI-2E family transporter n=1 Tax=Maritimibacter sp. 55A14 TaxID=2174844 RepID=UPI000D61B8CA|nr:AI-2E family transporter [Maritimibacter sp. 55A14]PWE34206.1 AI-2E family transporter [Maritimibacter sp. 55A14]